MVARFEGVGVFLGSLKEGPVVVDDRVGVVVIPSGPGGSAGRMNTRVKVGVHSLRFRKGDLCLSLESHGDLLDVGRLV